MNRKISIIILILIIVCVFFSLNNIGYKTYKSNNFEVKYKNEWNYEESKDMVSFYFSGAESAFIIKRMENKSNKTLDGFSNEYRSTLSFDTVKASNVQVTDIKLKGTLGKIDCKKFEFDMDAQGLEDLEGNKIEKSHLIQLVAVKGRYIYTASFRISQTINGNEKIFIDEKTYKKIEDSIKI